VEIILQGTVGEWDANGMNNYAQQDLRYVQAKDSVANSLVVVQRPILLIDLHSHAPAREDEWASNKEIDNWVSPGPLVGKGTQVPRDENAERDYDEECGACEQSMIPRCVLLVWHGGTQFRAQRWESEIRER